MMLPNQINLQTFTQTGKGGYKAIEVDAFLQRVYQSYNKLYLDNKALCERLDETAPLIEEYKKSKNSIADALIWAKSTAEKNIEEAQSIADKLVAEATQKADSLFNEKKAEADAYYTEKTSAANAEAEKAEAELESLKKQAEIFSDKYIAEINARAKQIVEDANEKAAGIVADAYADAKNAKEKADGIIEKANKELNALKAEASKIKNEILSLVSYAQKAAEEVENRIFEPVFAVADEKEAVEAQQIAPEEIEPFNLDGLQISDVEIEAEAEPEALQTAAQSEYVRFFDRQLPEVEDILSGIFTAAGQGQAVRTDSEDDNSFKFTNIFADPADRGDTRIFNTLMKDSE